MLGVAGEFAPARDSVNWAEDAVGELDLAIRKFFKDDAAEIVTEFDANTGENVQKVRLKKTFPRHLARKATECLAHARSAFDQATFAARNLTSGRSSKSIYFPWAETPRDLDILLKKRDIDERLWDIFRAHEPYPRSDSHAGGDNVFRTLATLANNKHTVGLSVMCSLKSYRPPPIDSGFRRLKVMVPTWDPKENEAVLLRWIGELKLYGAYDLGFEVGFDDPRLADLVSAVTALRAFARKAKVLTEDLQTRCLEICA